MDYEYFLRAGPSAKFVYSDKIKGNFRIHSESKTSQADIGFSLEHVKVGYDYARQLERKEASMYTHGLKCRYARHMISAVLNDLSDPREHSAKTLTRALVNCPELVREEWVRLLLIKSVIGESRYRRLRKLVRGT
jgi:hypothetical protein